MSNRRYHRASASLAMTLFACAPSQAPVRASTDLVSSDTAFVPATDPRVAVMGRVNANSDGSLRFGYPGVTLRVAFHGASLAWRAASTSSNSRVAVIVDGGAPATLRVAEGSNQTTLAEGLSSGEHNVDIVHRTEAWQGIITVDGFLLGAGSEVAIAKPWPERRLLLIGDSVTSGEGVDRTGECSGDKPASSNAYMSYGMRLARGLNAQVHLVSYGGRGLVRDWQGKRDVLNAPQFVNLAIPEEQPRILWNHASYQPDVVLISLGTNDFNLALGAPPDRRGFVAAYVSFVRALRGVYRDARIFVTEGAMLEDGTDPSRRQKTTLRSYIADTVRELGDERVHAIPAEHYPGDDCDGHPTREGHAAMARDLEPVIRQAMAW